MNDRTVIPQEIAEDAAEWFARLETEPPSEATRVEFVQWLTRSPVHIEEFLRVSGLHFALSRELKSEPDLFGDVLAEANVAHDNVVRMTDVERPSIRRERNAARQVRLLWTAAAVLLGAAGIAAIVSLTGLLPTADRGERFTTTIGEQRRVVLPDGSGVYLNTGTEILVRMDDRLRRVDLIRGEAIFDVAKNPARPFRVVSGIAAVEAIGTRFNVYRQQERTVVTVVEGRVLVSPLEEAVQSPLAVDAGGRARPDRGPAISPGASDRVTETGVVLNAGHKVTVMTDGTVAEPGPADVERATSWISGRMVFDSDTLATVVAEFNRYNTERLVIVDPELSDRRITGIFRVDAPESFLALLASLDRISVERSGDGTLKIRRTQESPRH